MARATASSLQQLLAEDGSQMTLSTHSPILARLGGARILEAGAWGIREKSWDELDLVTNRRLFLEASERSLRHLRTADD